VIWAVSLSTMELIPHSLTAAFSLTGIRSLADFSKLVGPLGHPVALPPARNTRRCTEMHFGENQLSRSLIGLSPLPTGHPPGFQPWWVRASTRSYPRFTLPMGRSLRFGSTACDSTALLGLAFATASPHGLTSPHTITRRLILQKARSHFTHNPERSCNAPTACRHTVSGTISPPSPGCFSPFPHGTGPLSVIREYLGLPGGPGRFTQDFSGPVLLGIPPGSR
jgi:hypothetical protein